MNRITNKEYLIDIAIQSFETQQPPTITKVKCEVHYSDCSYLRINFQPYLRNGSALFDNQRLRIPYSSELSLVFKLVKTNKKQIFIGHYSIDIEKMLAQKLFHFKIRDKLEDSYAYVAFECEIIDKELLPQSDTQETQLDVLPHKSKADIRSNPANIKHRFSYDIKIKTNKTFSDFNQPKSIKKQLNIPLPPEEYVKLVRQTEDILRKRQKFEQRQMIISQYSRDKQGRLKSPKIQALRERLDEVKRQNFNSNLVLYIITSVAALFIGMKV